MVRSGGQLAPLAVNKLLLLKMKTYGETIKQIIAVTMYEIALVARYTVEVACEKHVVKCVAKMIRLILCDIYTGVKC